jgi:hypothetical protein
VTLDGKLMAVPVKSGSTFEAGPPVVLFDTHDQDALELGYAVRADGQRFLVSRTFAERTGVVPRAEMRRWFAMAA